MLSSGIQSSEIVYFSHRLTSIGKYPGKCVSVMNKIAEYVENTERFKKKKKIYHGLKSILYK
jgi:pyruvate kinase